MTIDDESLSKPDVEVNTADTGDSTPPQEGVPIPGMDIFSVVERSIMQQAEVGVPPRYAFIRNDIYNLVLTMQPHLGPMRWVDEGKGLDCLLLPFHPLEGQNQFKLAYSYEEAHDIYISSFPEGTFSYLPPSSIVQTDGGTDLREDDLPKEGMEVVETNNG
jgi:hypothetical protein